MHTRRSFVGGLLGLFAAAGAEAKAAEARPQPAAPPAAPPPGYPCGATVTLCYSSAGAGVGLDPNAGLICGVDANGRPVPR
jgi:hypothetical protein